MILEEIKNHLLKFQAVGDQWYYSSNQMKCKVGTYYDLNSLLVNERQHVYSPGIPSPSLKVLDAYTVADLPYMNLGRRCGVQHIQYLMDDTFKISYCHVRASYLDMHL